MNEHSNLLKEKLEKKKEIRNQIERLIYTKKKLERNLDTISKEILNICPHKWVIDESSFG
ncbi:unnamed protein product, partial [marine sediment metagenome]